MTRMTGRWLSMTLVVLTSTTLAQSLGTDIGVAEWVNPSTSRQPPGTKAVLELEHGARLIEKEMVLTNPAGVADFSFYNRSRLLVGPKCRVVLDHRYYDRELDVEVREFSLYTSTRCVLKADNTVSANPKDQIVIKTSNGKIIIINGNITLVLTQDQLTAFMNENGTVTLDGKKLKRAGCSINSNTGLTCGLNDIQEFQFQNERVTSDQKNNLDFKNIINPLDPYVIIDRDPGNKTHDPGNRTHDPGNRIHDPGNRIHDPGNRIHDPGNRIHDPGNRIHDPGNRIHDPGNRDHDPGGSGDGGVEIRTPPFTIKLP